MKLRLIRFLDDPSAMETPWVDIDIPESDLGLPLDVIAQRYLVPGFARVRHLAPACNGCFDDGDMDRLEPS